MVVSARCAPWPCIAWLRTPTKISWTPPATRVGDSTRREFLQFLRPPIATRQVPSLE